MSSKLIHTKYLAVVLLGIVFIVLVSVDAFSQSEVRISGDFGARECKNFTNLKELWKIFLINL